MFLLSHGYQDRDPIDERVSEIMASMAPEEKIGQLFVVSWNSPELEGSLETLIADYHVGGVYISGANFANTEEPTAAEQVAELANELQRTAWQDNRKTSLQGTSYYLPLFLATDHEGDGARHTRIRSGMTAIPSLLAIGATWSPENAENVGRIVGSELSSIGINMLLGPVLDVVDDPATGSKGNLDTRVFGGDPHWVGELGRAYIRGVHEGSNYHVLTVAKHFPGHGDSDRATDRAIAETGKEREELLEVDLVPFIRAAEQLDDLGTTDAMMSSHIGIQETDDYPISLYYDYEQQKGGITKLVQEVDALASWYENGFMVSDNLGVGALKPLFRDKDEAQIAKEALLAGNDLLIVHGFIENPVGATDEAVHQKIMEVMEHFRTLYQTDDRVQRRVDEAVRKIVRAKLLMSEDLSLESVLVPEPFVIPANENKEAKEEAILRTATESIALISPDRLPTDLTLEQNDRIVFIVHNVGYPECERCTDDWRLLRVDYFANFLTENRNFDGTLLTSLNYYQEIYQGRDSFPGFSQFLYWHYLDYAQEARDEMGPEEALWIDSQIRHADWIIFAFLTGDCGPDAYRINDPFDDDAIRCNRGRPEADTLIQFLEIYDTDAKIGAISFGAPPWTLDTTTVSQLDIYLGAFSQLVPFQEQALRVFLRELQPVGASPIDVEGANYYLEDRLQPDSNQEISLSVLNPPNGDWLVGDRVQLETSEVVDHNGNPVISNIPATWSATNRDLAISLQPVSASTVLEFGKAHATFDLSEAGETTFSVEIGDVESEALQINVVSAPGEVSPQMMRATDTPIISGQAQDIEERVAATSTASTDAGLTSQTPSVTQTPAALASTVFGLIAVTLTAAAVLVWWRIAKGRARFEGPMEEVDQVKKAYRPEVYELLNKSFDQEELKTLCFSMDVDYDNLPATGKAGKARELVLHLERRDQISRLESELRRLRPDITWPLLSGNDGGSQGKPD